MTIRQLITAVMISMSINAYAEVVSAQILKVERIAQVAVCETAGGYSFNGTSFVQNRVPNSCVAQTLYRTTILFFRDGRPMQTEVTSDIRVAVGERLLVEINDNSVLW